MEHNNSSLVEWLPVFFKQWPHDTTWAREPDKKINIDTERLAEFFKQLSDPLKAIQHSSLSFDPWEVAGLGRKEVRNTAVLAWLLDPEGTHGFGRLPLQAFLRAIRHSRNDIPDDYHRYCRVQVETNPTGDNTNRVDIEIDADNFFLLIEVKIDAYEQQGQVARYCSEARVRAISRPWAVVFLTPSGGKPLTCGVEFKPGDVPCLSWRHLATTLEVSLQSHVKELLSQGKSSSSRQMAAHAVFCFLNRVRTF